MQQTRFILVEPLDREADDVSKGLASHTYGMAEFRSQTGMTGLKLGRSRCPLSFE